MAEASTDQTQKIEQKITTVLTGGDSKNTQAEVDSIMDMLPAHMEKHGVNLETGERTTPPEAKPRKETTPPTDDQKESLKNMLEEDGQTKTARPPRQTKAEKVEKVETKSETKDEKVVEKKETKPAPKPFEDLSDDGINREVESLKTGKAETKERYGALLRELKTAREAGDLTKKEFEQAKKDLEATRQTAEEAAKKAVIPEDVVKQQQAEKEELAMLRRQYQLERDPELKKNYDDKIDEVEKAIGVTLTEAGLSPKAVEFIQKAGGWLKFSSSNAPMAWNDQDADGQPIVKNGTYAEYARYILERVNPSASATVNARAGEQVSLRDAKDRFVGEEKKKATEYFKNLEESFKKNQQATQENLKKLTEQYDKWTEEVFSKEDALKDEVVPDKATADERKEIEEANKDRATIRDYIKAQKTTTSLGGYQELVMNAAKGLLADKLAEATEAEVAELKTKLENAEAELAKVRGGNRSVTKGGSLTGSGAATLEKPAKKEASVESILEDLDNLAKKE